MSLLIDNIGSLVTNDPAWGGLLGVIPDAAVVVEEQPSGSSTAVGARSRSLSRGLGQIAWVGPRGEAPDADERLDADGRAVLPGFVESHSHLVFAGERAEEFAARILPTLRGFKAIMAYECPPDASVSCPITAYIGDEDEIGTLERVEPWSRRTTGEFTLREFTGHHFYINDHLNELAADIESAVAKTACT